MSNDKAKVLRTGFYTTQSLGDKGCIRIDFKSLAELHQADDELRAFMARPAEQHQGEPVCWVNDQQLLLCSKSPRVVEPDNPMMHNLPRNIAGSALQSEYCNTPLFRSADSAEVVALRGAYLRAGEREHELRTELATWKRRAIEAESKLRTYDPQILELSQREMEVLLAEPRPTELVLMKCVLCDQLQADLTKLDEKLDQTQDLLRYMVYDYRSVVQAGYDKITGLGSDCDSVDKMLADNPNYQKALALLLPDLESRPEERGTPETEPCSGCGTPGWTGACNKCVPY
ncbi:hypothetical protein [Pseudomonas sp. NBRC 111139]|uniref:hypothetical protein n=1 Tax=Pseudomonas sp. NBRC 111139 TaxID=1661054 RepID=UPI0008635B6C|nr:hypothetical protein [Pseudomonas sp. NBRC 111139]